MSLIMLNPAPSLSLFTLYVAVLNVQTVVFSASGKTWFIDQS